MFCKIHVGLNIDNMGTSFIGKHIRPRALGMKYNAKSTLNIIMQEDEQETTFY
jgi:hypothetical protein